MSSSWTATGILATLRAERAKGKEPTEFAVTGCRYDGLYAHLTVKGTRRSGALDERLEGARAWWPGDPPGTADVLQVDAERSEIVLRYMSRNAPVNGLVRLYEPDFLEPLEELWSTPSATERALIALGECDRPSGLDPVDCGVSLRVHQADAIALSRRTRALLHGPPGTGKTHTLVAMIAGLLRGKCGRVLFIAPTHLAVDDLVLRLDHLLDKLGDHVTRQKMKRWGTRFNTQIYQGRGHLLPVVDEVKLEQLAVMEVSEPPRADVAAWARWRDALEAGRQALRADLPTVIRGCQLLAMTTAAAVFNWHQLAECRWDLLLVDEASQVTGAAAVMCASLAGATIFAGDPKQLAAVVRTDHLNARRYLETTAFDVFSTTASSVRLNEQSRMAPDICRVVSRVFYEGELTVARDKASDPKWLDDRSPCYINGRKQAAAQIIEIEEEGTWSQKYGGPIRYSSATAILNTIDELTGISVHRKDVLVLTPYRAQRTLLRAMLKSARHSEVQVSTVHRAQGGERLIVLFDPVDGTRALLSGAPGSRLINVAISRAMAHVFIYLSRGDLINPILLQIARFCSTTGLDSESTDDRGTSSHRHDRLPTITDFSSRPDFPRCLENQVLKAGLCQGRVTAVLWDRKFVIQDEEDGVERTLSIDYFLRQATEPT